MKSSSTVHLEEKFWNLIRNYQIDNKLSSRNDAIQLILTEWEILRGLNYSLEDKPIEVKDEPREVEEELEVDPMILNGLLSIKDTMK